MSRRALAGALVIWLAVAAVAAVAAAQTTLPQRHDLRNAAFDTVAAVRTVLDGSALLLESGTAVRTGEFTTFVGVAGVADLSPGDIVQTTGERLSPWAAMASLVRLISYSDPVLIDTVAAVIDGTSFLLSSQAIVVTDETTVFDGLGGVSDLVVGDLVRVEGSWTSASVFAATAVALMQEALGSVTANSTIALLVAPDVIILADATSATVDDETRWVNLSGYQDLAVGDHVRVTGIMEAGSLSMDVDEVELVGESEGEFIAFAGVVLGLASPNSIQLFAGKTVTVDDATTLSGFASLDELSAGDELWIEAVTTADPDVFHALAITLTGEDSGLVEFVSTVAAVFPPDIFVTADGHSVIVGPETTLEGLTAVTDLEAGDTVFVSGSPGDSPLSVAAELVILMDGEDGGGNGDGHGSGLEANVMGAIDRLVPPRVMIVDDIVITVDKTTEWQGDLGSFDDLAVGMGVLAAVVFHEDGYLLAQQVKNLGQLDATPVFLSGEVEEKALLNRFLLDSGEWIAIDGATVLDGDVDDVEEIDVGMDVYAECVATGPGEYLALWIFVSDIRVDPPFFGPEATETTEALVVLVDGADAAAVAARHGATVTGTLPGNLVHLFQWVQPVTEDEMHILVSDPDVADAEANYQFQDPETIRRHMPIADRAPTSERFVAQAAMAQASIMEAHQRSLGENTMVAVLDTGVDPFHPLLRQRLAPGGWDFVDGDGEPWETQDGIDQDGDSVIDEAAGHGTFVAGLVLLTAPGTRVLPYRVLNDDGRGTTFVICEAVLDAVDSGADVINMSFVYTRRSRILDRILDEASRRGVVLVSGAGNEGGTNIPFPARDHRVLAVAAVDETGQLAEFSNHGPAVAVAAPGVELYSGLPEGEFGTWSGTSMAAPLVSGTVALLRAVNPYLTPDQVEAALKQSAVPLADGSTSPALLQVSSALDLVPTLP